MANQADRYVFPAVFAYYADGIHITFPDIPGCVSFGQTEAAALEQAKEALGLHLYGMEEDGEEIPVASRLADVPVEPHHGVTLVEVFMPPIRLQLDNSAVKKTLTIPAWLNALAEEHHVNYSQLLQKALKDHLGLQDRP